MGQALLRLASHLFSSLAVVRRRWYASHPAARRQLARPVISVGNLSFGGSGKTPLVAAVARLLIEWEERPAILSRGYRRRRSREAVVVVSDGVSLQTDVAHAGDEPFMLACAVPSARVVVSSRRFLAGRLAEVQLGCTVHVLDDGFQHLPLARDIDLLIVTSDDLAKPDTMPLGRLREPLSAGAAADAIVVWSNEPLDPVKVAGLFDVRQSFRMHHAIEMPRTVSGWRPVVDERAGLQPPGPAFGIAGIARPKRFFDDLQRAGWTLAGTRAFPDHHQFTGRDLAEIATAAEAVKATVVLMTEKDMVRLPKQDAYQSLPPEVRSLVWAWVPLRVTMDSTFAPWLRDRMVQARGAAQRRGAQGPHERSRFVGVGAPRFKK